MIKLEDITIEFGEDPLFQNLSWTITPEPHRVGLVGPNGAGKTTLLKVIAGDQRVDSGTITREGVSIGYLEQDVQELPEDRTVREEALRAFEEVLALEEQEQEISRELEAIDHESDRHEKLLNRLHRVQERLDAQDAHRIRPRTEATLTGLGFAPDELDRPLRTFSGGWRMRAALARLLLKQPDVLLLDEPTNHLDIESIDWLEDTLETYPGAVILVSHDRSVLDRMVTSTAELVRGRLLHYDGNYSHYLEAREARYERWRRKYENQQKRIEKIQEFISKFRYNAARASQVQSRIKKLEKMDRIPPPPDPAPAMSFEFPEPPRSGVVVLELSAFSKTYDTEHGPETVFTDAGPLTIERGDKVALVGPNGAGKSTLARIIGGREDFAGTRTEGHNVEMAFHAQHQAKTMDPDQTVFDTVREAAPDRPKTELRSLLGRFLFTSEDAFKDVRVLSGGEKSRLSLARTLLSPANLLLLDEPTNHLDIQSREVLIEALQKYEGTFVLVSHDRHVLDAVAEKTWRVGGGTVRTFLGNYSDFRWQVEEGSARPLQDVHEAEPPAEPSPNGHDAATSDTDPPAEDNDPSAPDARPDGPFADLNSYQLKQKLEDTEARILEIEEKQEELEAAMADPDAYDGDGVEARELSDEYNALKKELSGLYEEWEVLTEHVMALED
ncbi:ribosomal protection-like ABC-F family protein [Salinibacter ruber]|uniref:ribosomal protection-like ABC-F family protein n=1 Tax=Salinibacter ruber TaxID=146919 RepID=UPI00207393A5|nr:ABC-F family ATP-binding cassette domain-containing protein [Salinibacter ruber]MCS3640458.1 ATP-binding cassette subfamily F protein 3 [Salinibacter ruber]MCS4100270.1 ATP-binding cassette subfamily F protein 3 [Salinibacter ruber]